MLNYLSWGPADWLAIFFISIFLGKCVCIIVLYVLGWIGVVMTAVFRLGKGPSDAAMPSHDQRGGLGQ